MTSSYVSGRILFTPQATGIQNYVESILENEIEVSSFVESGMNDLLNYLEVDVTPFGILAEDLIEKGSDFSEHDIAAAINNLIEHAKNSGCIANGSIIINFDDGDDETVEFNVDNNKLYVTTYELVPHSKPFEEGKNIFVS